MEDEKLILLVQERSEIYNKYNPLFKYVDKKEEAWMDIANEMGTTAEDCTRRWTSIRDRYTREIKKMERSSGKAVIMWPFFEMLSFLRPFVSSRPIRDSKFSRSKLMPSVLKKELAHTPLVRKSSPPSSPAPSTSASPAMECGDFTQIFDDPLIEAPLPPKRNVVSNPDVDKSFCDAVEALKKACALNEAKHANPAVYAFGEMIVSTICSMNSRNQVKVMQQVTDTVMRIKLEEDELLEQVSYSSL